MCSIELRKRASERMSVVAWMDGVQREFQNYVYATFQRKSITRTRKALQVDWMHNNIPRNTAHDIEYHLNKRSSWMRRTETRNYAKVRAHNSIKRQCAKHKT